MAAVGAVSALRAVPLARTASTRSSCSPALANPRCCAVGGTSTAPAPKLGGASFLSPARSASPRASPRARSARPAYPPSGAGSSRAPPSTPRTRNPRTRARRSESRRTSSAGISSTPCSVRVHTRSRSDRPANPRRDHRAGCRSRPTSSRARPAAKPRPFLHARVETLDRPSDGARNPERRSPPFLPSQPS